MLLSRQMLKDAGNRCLWMRECGCVLWFNIINILSLALSFIHYPPCVLLIIFKLQMDPDCFSRSAGIRSQTCNPPPCQAQVQTHTVQTQLQLHSLLKVAQDYTSAFIFHLKLSCKRSSCDSCVRQNRDEAKNTDKWRLNTTQPSFRLHLLSG